MTLTEWWLTYGWQELLLRGYRVSFAVAIVATIAAALVRVHRGSGLSGAASSRWLIPVLVWALQALGAAMTATQLDLVTGLSRVPYMMLDAGTSALAGVSVIALTASSVRLLSRQPLAKQRTALVLFSMAWGGALVAWLGVIVREWLLSQRA